MSDTQQTPRSENEDDIEREVRLGRKFSLSEAIAVSVLADEKHRHGLTNKASLPTLVRGRVLWHLGYRKEARAAALTQSDQACQRMALDQEPSHRVRGILTEGVDSTTKRLRTLVPGAHLGNGLRHALKKLPKTLAAMASPVRTALRSQVHTLWYRACQRQGWRVFALRQR